MTRAPASTESSTATLPGLSRRSFMAATLHSSGLIAANALALSCLSGCVPQSGIDAVPELVWGRRGLSEGRFMKPRAMVIDPQDQLHIVDMTGRIQIFDRDGNYLRGWRTPLIAQGKPTGMGFARDGSLLVADTHYFRVLFYNPDGVLDEARTIGGEHGDAAGQFHFVTDVAENAQGHFFVGQYGQVDRIQEFDPAGQFIRYWGTQGSGPAEFSRPQGLIFDRDGLLWVLDACNHRIQIFDVTSPGPEPKLVDMWGSSGSAVGQLQYPYGIDFDQDGTLLIAEFGNHRIQRFSRSGEPLEVWGQVGTAPGQFSSPWALGIDSQKALHVLDTMNHRVQRFQM